MSAENYKKLMHEVLDERSCIVDLPKKNKKAKKELIVVNILLGFSLFIFFATWIVAAYSWLSYGTFPEELVRYTSALLGISCCAYCGKTAYEYKVDKDCEKETSKFS